MGFPISILGEFRLSEIDAYEMMVRPALWRREMCTLVKSAQNWRDRSILGDEAREGRAPSYPFLVGIAAEFRRL